MPPLTIVLLIFVLINWVLVKRWMDQVERGVVSFFKYHVVLFLFLMLVLIPPWLGPASRLGSAPEIKSICYGISAGLVLISAISVKTDESQKFREDLRIWTGGATLLMFGTGVLTLMIHVPNSTEDVTHLLGFVAVVFYSMFLREPR